MARAKKKTIFHSKMSASFTSNTAHGCPSLVFRQGSSGCQVETVLILFNACVCALLFPHSSCHFARHKVTCRVPFLWSHFFLLCLIKGYSHLWREAWRPGRSGNLGCYADFWACRPSPVWQIWPGHHYHHSWQTEPLLDLAHSAEPNWEPVPKQPRWQPQRRGKITKIIFILSWWCQIF